MEQMHQQPQPAGGKAGERKKRKTGLIIVLAAVVVLGAGALGFFRLGSKFQDVTVEAGTEQVQIDGFLRNSIYKDFSSIAEGAEAVDLNKAGNYPLTLSMAGKREVVVLHVVDTTSPAVEFTDITRPPGYELKAEDFILSAEDLSEIEAIIEGSAPSTDGFGVHDIRVIVRDASGNETSKDCRLVISWLRTEAQIQLGSVDFLNELVYDAEKDAGNIPEEALAAVDINKLGHYDLSFEYEGETISCKIDVVDTLPPELKLRDISVYNDSKKTFSKDDFIVSASDNSGEVTTTLLSELKFSGTGTQTVTIKAEDPNGNSIEVSAKYIRHEDTDPPVFSGLSKLSVKKNGSPNYEKGVSAKDEHDGSVSFTYNSSSVDLTKAGTYVVTYTAKDKSGNVGTAKRQLEVQHDASDTAALVKKVASQCGDSLKEIYNFVKNKIKFSHNEGGSDPTWHGFTNWSGDCIVHAYCYKALLEAKGYSSQIIWTTGLEHHWNLVYYKDQWWHSDTTPTQRALFLGNDEQRLKTLRTGRTWDRTRWPECP